MADEVDEEGAGDQNRFPKCSKAKKKQEILDNIVPIHKQISDVGQFSYAALCATALRTLFEAEHQRKFREEALAVILISIEQPQQVCESVQAMLLGHGMDDLDPFVDILLAEDVLKKGAEPIISQLLAVSIGQGCYDSRMRVLIKHLAWRLRVSWDTLEDIECAMSESLAFAQYEMSDEEKEERARKEKRSKLKRYALIGLATVGGGTLIGLTGGLAAPLVAAGAGAFIGGAGAAVLGSAAGVAVIGSLFGVAGAGLTGYKMKRRVGAIEEFQFEPLVCGNSLRVEHLNSQLHITIAVTGWLSNSMRDFKQPWKQLAESKEQYTLRWETKYLVQLGEAMDYMLNSAMAVATQEALKHTVLQGLIAAVAWPAALLSAANIIDNPWSVALQRAHSAGRQLAEVLLAREQGKRPVTLVGYSLGARVLFSCLEELAQRKGGEGMIEDVILLGTPATADPNVWAKFGPIVAGKIVNGFCRADWLLKFVYRTSSVQLSIAGLRPVKWEDRRMHNIDLSDVVSGHMDYMKQLDIIMKAVGIRTREDVRRSASKSFHHGDCGTDDGGDVSVDDLSDSDSEMFCSSEAEATTADSSQPTGPVILEDYTASGQESRSESFHDRDGQNPDGATLPESVSFDSGVEIAKVESESKDRVTGVSSPSKDSKVGEELSGLLSPSKDEEGATVSSGEKNWTDGSEFANKNNACTETVSTETVSKKNEPAFDECQDSEEGTLNRQDRVGDAALDDDSGDTTLDNWPHLRRTVSTDESELGDDMASNLQRKKMFDSMYRLILDDDILSSDDDDDNGDCDGGHDMPVNS